jgi:hypothetical protein
VGRQIWYVDAAACPGPGSGTAQDPFCTIGQALGVAQAGDTVLVARGTYEEHLQLVSGVDVLGEDAATTILDGGGVAQDVVSAISVADVTFAGFTVTGARSGGALPGGAGVFVNFPSSTVVVEDVIARDNDIGFAVFNGFQGSGPSFLDCDVHDNFVAGVYEPSGVLSGCRIYHNGDGVTVSGSSTMPLIENNTIWENNGGGMLFWNDRVATVRNNIFARNGRFGIEEFLAGPTVDPLVENNLFFENAAGNYFDIRTQTIKNTAEEINAQANAEDNLVVNPLLCSPPETFDVCASSPTLGAGYLGANIGAGAVGCGAPFASYGSGLAGSGDFVPTLGPFGCSTPGRAVRLTVGQGLGGAPGALAGSTSAASLPFRGGTLLVSPPFALLLPHTLAGEPGVAGRGTAALTLAIPPDPGLVGTPFFFQAAYLDSGAPGGVSLTAGVSGTIQ